MLYLKMKTPLLIRKYFLFETYNSYEREVLIWKFFPKDKYPPLFCFVNFTFWRSAQTARKCVVSMPVTIRIARASRLSSQRTKSTRPGCHLGALKPKSNWRAP